MVEESSLRLSGRPPRDLRLEPYLRNGQMWGTFFALAGVRHAADDANPRPLPQTTLYEVKQRMAAAAPSGTGPVPDALFLAFSIDRDRHRMPAEQAIAVPAEHLWWLAAEHDTVLLSDRVTHHYTTVAKVDREQERIYFHDFWPEDFFLLPGRNALGVEARGLSVSKAEFLRAAVGLITWDTLHLLDHYFVAFPEQRANANAELCFGFALLDTEAELFSARAAGLFADAARLADKAGSHELAVLSARQAYLAGICGAYRAGAASQPKVTEAMSQILNAVVSQHGRETLESALSPRELTRLGNAAGNARDFKTALNAWDQAIAKDPEFEDAYWLRAAARLQRGEFEDAVADARRAVGLNDVALARLEAERAALDPRGKFEIEWKDAQIGGRQLRRESELAALGRAYLALGDFTRARESAGEMIASRPDRALGHFMLAHVERKAGRRVEAAAALREAIAREQVPQTRSGYEQMLREVEGLSGGQ